MVGGMKKQEAEQDLKSETESFINKSFQSIHPSIKLTSV